MKVRIINDSRWDAPSYATEGSAGVDLKANIDDPITLTPLQRVVVPTGLRIALPKGTEAQVRPRSGLAAKHGITVLNTPGTIDADYRGEYIVAIHNDSDIHQIVHPGERIAQMILMPFISMDFKEVDALTDTIRGEGGFGSTDLGK